jgi:predicted dehydrogenase
MQVAIVGCGVVGIKRSQALVESRLVLAVDADLGRAERIAAAHEGCGAGTDWGAAVGRDDVDLVIVATTNDALTPVALAAVRQGKHVLVEKPAARSAAELRPLVEAARAAGVVAKAGFNHRFHPGVARARELCGAGAVGPLLYVRGRYGHGGRLGYEQEWRANPSLAGGGELLDQGVHLIDLARWFIGDFTEVRGLTETFFWKMPMEDNAFVLLRTADGRVAWIHASCTEWKNLFSLEVFGRDGKLQVDGLGGSYGTERLTYYRMRPEMGPPETTCWEYPGEDVSWREEYRHLLDCIRERRPPCGGLEDALAALEVVESVYTQSRRPPVPRTGWDAP